MKRSIAIYLIMLWMALAIPAVIMFMINFGEALFKHFSSTPKIFQIMRGSMVPLVIIELIYLWKVNTKALLVADGICGVFTVVNILTLLSTLIRSTDPTPWQLVKPLVLLIINVAMIVYITRHSFLDRSAVIAHDIKTAEANERFQKEQLDRAWEIRKRQNQ